MATLISNIQLMVFNYSHLTCPKDDFLRQLSLLGVSVSYVPDGLAVYVKPTSGAQIRMDRTDELRVSYSEWEQKLEAIIFTNVNGFAQINWELKK